MGDPGAFAPWIDPHAPHHAGRPAEAIATELAAERDAGLARSGLGAPEVEAYRAAAAVRVLTPGSTAGEPVHRIQSAAASGPSFQTG